MARQLHSTVRWLCTNSNFWLRRGNCVEGTGMHKFLTSTHRGRYERDQDPGNGVVAIQRHLGARRHDVARQQKSLY